MLNNIKYKVIGCKEKCPLCGKICDSEHKNKFEKHNCMTGHLYLAFKGKMWMKTNEPILKTCSDLEDDDDI